MFLESESRASLSEMIFAPQIFSWTRVHGEMGERFREEDLDPADGSSDGVTFLLVASKAHSCGSVGPMWSEWHLNAERTGWFGSRTESECKEVSLWSQESCSGL